MIKRMIRRLIYSYRTDSKTYVEYLRRGGVQIGERTYIYDPRTTIIDMSRPWMISIGNDVQITAGVTILTHGYDWSVMKGLYGDVCGSCGEVRIGNNCFIGMHTTILKGVHIGNNCIIGANSLVNSDIEDGWVVAGNPAKPIMRVEDYYEKRKAVQVAEATELYKCYVEKMNQEPPKEVFDEFFYLFEKRDERVLSESQKDKMKCVGNYSKSLETYLKLEPYFDGYNEFLKYMRERK